MAVLPRAFTVTHQWEKVPPRDYLDEDYVLRAGGYFAVVSTRADCTAWHVYRGEYSRAAEVAHRVVAVDHLQYDASEMPIPESYAAAEIAAMSEAEEMLRLVTTHEQGARFRPVSACTTAARPPSKT